MIRDWKMLGEEKVTVLYKWKVKLEMRVGVNVLQMRTEKKKENGCRLWVDECLM